MKAKKSANSLIMYYRINNVNDKNDNSNDHGQSYRFKETLREFL